MVGRTLAHYKILEKIGSGGMGDVYLAQDTKLDRKVALKVLPSDLAERDERRARFEREAKALAALNHPNITTVYSVELSDSIHFITMELVKAERSATLRYALAVTDSHLYFTWEEDRGDIWVMDVATDK